ncbi:SID1 transmembrane family member 1-like [Ptychodera flava]|uniref:SID1 transmembrane family member 1-like n=1 Tax=Ptychodera flava TaxID=63121 RepID=UPI003969EDFB
MGQKTPRGCAIPRFVLFVLLGVTVSVQPSWSLASNDDGGLTHELDTLYHGTVKEGEETEYVFQVRGGMNKSIALRVEVNSSNALETYPVMFVVTQQEGIISWKLPLEILSVHKYDTVARTLCPMNFGEKPVNDVLVRVTCSSPNATDYSLIVTVVNDFEMELSTPQTVMASPSQPQYYYFKFPENVKALQVRAHSKDKICATISVQEATELETDDDDNEDEVGTHVIGTIDHSSIIDIINPSDKPVKIYRGMNLCVFENTDDDDSNVCVANSGAENDETHNDDGHPVDAGSSRHALMRIEKIETQVNYSQLARMRCYPSVVIRGAAWISTDIPGLQLDCFRELQQHDLTLQPPMSYIDEELPTYTKTATGRKAVLHSMLLRMVYCIISGRPTLEDGKETCMNSLSFLAPFRTE